MSETATQLSAKKCKPCQRGDTPLSPAEIERLLLELDGWARRDGVITKTFRFPDYWHTMAFVNATAWISHREDHHPDLHVGYDSCRIDYCTHAIGGLSENDFICAAKVDALLRL
ncbi:MAG: 4a-hydroxytetrahydrobiopterin dehydratase [Burkholderiales bacterium]